jgi:hypothetical protein
VGAEFERLFHIVIILKRDKFVGQASARDTASKDRVPVIDKDPRHKIQLEGFEHFRGAVFFGNKDRGFEDDAEVNIVKAHKGQRAAGVHDAVGPA